MVRHRSESSKMGQVGPLLQAAVGGCKCKLARKLLEPLMRSATVNKMSVKLGILYERRRHHLEHQPRRRTTERDLQWRKSTLMFLKRAWNSTKAKEGYLG
ncbi:hypothetical protein B296_00050388 [Ensete ventricosum]|uniref:Uncharacterized protein n=1 Tax=Ensete ventricosum TaxID=4639 RepID=A0A426XF03_ENSVE|nr:hypothetical protein B296_00050388 [Ensete ventricosum]